MAKYIVRGVISPHGANYELVGEYTYIAEVGGWYAWDGLHHAKRFDTWYEAKMAAGKANGPFFRMPDEDTIEVLEVE